MNSTQWRRKIEDLCAKMGWDFEVNPSGHFTLSKPGVKGYVTCAKTPSDDRRAFLNVRAQMRRGERGFDLRRGVN